MDDDDNNVCDLVDMSHEWQDIDYATLIDLTQQGITFENKRQRADAIQVRTTQFELYLYYNAHNATRH